MIDLGKYTAVPFEECDSLKGTAAVCPFYDHGVDEDVLALPYSLDGAEHHPDIGWYRMLFAGYANDRDFRENGSSGGIANWLAAELLQTDRIDGVIHVKPVESIVPGGVLFEYAVSNDLTGLTSGAKSKYYPVEMSRVMNYVRNNPGRYAFIGVPCFVKAVRLLARADEAIDQSITYCIALFCGHLKSRAFAEHAAWQMGIVPSSLTQFDFRTKVADSPANRYAVTARGMRDGQTVVATRPITQLQGSDWGMGFFKLKACDYCDDIVGETADVSIGDAWLPEYVSDSAGTNIVVARNPVVAEILGNAVQDGRLVAQPVTVAEVHKSQASNYRHRREGLAYRLALADKQGIWRPKKRVEPSFLAVTPERKAVLELRSQLSEYSHIFFESAKKAGRLALFADLITPIQVEYRRVLDAERRQHRLAETDTRSLGAPTITSSRQLARYYAKRLRMEFFRLNDILRTGALRFNRLVTFTPNSALVLPPTSAGSIGDDASVSSTLASLRKRGFKKIGLFSHNLTCVYDFTEKPDARFDISNYMSSQSKSSCLDMFKTVSEYDHMYVIGADVLDGYYSDQESHKRLMLADCAARLGMKTTLIGFSYNESPARLSLKTLKQLPSSVRVCARDPISHARLRKHLSTAPIQAADVAFLLEPVKPHDPELSHWIERARINGSPVYGINAIFTSKFFADKSLTSLANYLRFYQDLIKALLARDAGAQFVFIPHDYRPNGIGEGPILEHLLYSLPDSIQNHIYLLHKQYTAAEIKWLAGQVDFIVSSRMHLAIAAIGQCTPAFCFEYQGKFQGLFELIEQPDLLSSMEDTLTSPDQVINTVLKHVDDAQSIRSRLRKIIPTLLSLAEKNFDC